MQLQKTLQRWLKVVLYKHLLHYRHYTVLQRVLKRTIVFEGNALWTPSKEVTSNNVTSIKKKKYIFVVEECGKIECTMQ